MATGQDLDVDPVPI